MQLGSAGMFARGALIVAGEQVQIVALQSNGGRRLTLNLDHQIEAPQAVSASHSRRATSTGAGQSQTPDCAPPTGLSASASPG
jgi:hypothetical protein